MKVNRRRGGGRGASGRLGLWFVLLMEKRARVGARRRGQDTGEVSGEKWSVRNSKDKKRELGNWGLRIATESIEGASE